MLDRSCENSELAKSSQAPIFPDASLRSASQSELDRKLSNWRTRGRRASVQVAIRAIPKGGRSSGPPYCTGKLARVSLTRRRNRDGTRVKRKSALYVLNGPNSKRRCERDDVKIMRFAEPRDREQSALQNSSEVVRGLRNLPRRDASASPAAPCYPFPRPRLHVWACCNH